MGWYKDTMSGKYNKQITGAVLGGIVGGPVGAAAGAAIGNKSNRDFVKGVGGKIFGDKDDAGILGTGQFKADEIAINDKAYTDTKRFDQVNKDLANEIAMAKGIRMDAGPQNQSRGMQMDLARALQQQSQGGGPPSIAQQMLQNQTSQNIMNAQSQAASMRGINPAMALRMSQGQAANANQQAANQGAMLRSQEILNAQTALGGLTQGIRGQDIGFSEAGVRAGLGREELAMKGLGQQAQIAEAANQGARDLEQLKVNQRLGMSGVNAQAYGDAAKGRREGIQGIAGGIMEGLGLSDKNLKKDIEPARSDPAVQEFIDALTSSTYRYKDPKNGDERYLGPMAQDLEKTELGRGMVMDTPEGKMVDYGRGAPAFLGVAGILNDRLDDLEDRLGSFLEKKGSGKKS